VVVQNRSFAINGQDPRFFFFSYGSTRSWIEKRGFAGKGGIFILGGPPPRGG
jgi:hypothetical protein